MCPVLTNPISENVVYPVYDKKGDIVSTVEIEIDSTKTGIEIEKQKKQNTFLKSTQNRETIFFSSRSKLSNKTQQQCLDKKIRLPRYAGQTNADYQLQMWE